MSPQGEGIKVIEGIFLLFGLNIAVAALLYGCIALMRSLSLYWFDAVGWTGIFAIGLTQLLYVIPFVFWLKRRRRFATLKGVMIGVVLTFFLNGGCFLVFVSWLNSVYS